MKISHVVTDTELNCLLSDFIKKTKNKIYSKIDYQDWKLLWKSNLIKIFPNDEDGVYHVHLYMNKDDDFPTYSLMFPKNDGSFGSFLYYSGYGGTWMDTKTKKATFADGTTAVYSDSLSYYDDSLECKGICDKADSNAATIDYSYLLDKYDTISTATSTNSCWQVFETPTIEIDSTINDRIKTLEISVDELMEKNRKENDTMKFINFEFGPVTTDKVRMSIYGMAVRNAEGNYVAYDNKTHDLVNVDVFNFDGSKFLYRVPVAIKDVKPGDVVVHMKKPMIVLKTTDSFFSVIDVYEGDAKNIMPTKSPFGFNFMTKIVSLMDMCGGTSTATEDAPFGNMLPFLMMNEGGDMDPMMMMLMMGGKMDMSNPMMMYFLMKDSGNGNDMLPLLFMMGNASGASLASTVPAMPVIPPVE